ncbi:unnamed protein product, partial [Tetraodon nigroviridis]
TLLINPRMRPQQQSSGTCWTSTCSATSSPPNWRCRTFARTKETSSTSPAWLGPSDRDTRFPTWPQR